MTLSWDPRADDDKLQALAVIAEAMRLGRPVMERRLDEMAGGFPGPGGDGSGAADGGGPTLAAVVAKVDELRVDPADWERLAWEQELAKSLDYAVRAYERFRRVTQLRLGVVKVENPCCELCAKVPCGCDRCSAIDHRHWCDVVYSVEVTSCPTCAGMDSRHICHLAGKPIRRKAAKPIVRLVPLCSSCYEFQRPDRFGYLPEHDDVLDHVEGRRRRRKVKPGVRAS